MSDLDDLERDQHGNIIVKPVTGWTTGVVFEMTRSVSALKSRTPSAETLGAFKREVKVKIPITRFSI